MFFFGICATIHQTLIVAAMGIEIGIASRDTRLGRDLFLGNSIAYFTILVGMAAGMIPGLTNATSMVQSILHGVGIASIVACVWLTIQTGSLLTEVKSVVWMFVVWVAGFGFYLYEPLAGMTNPPMEWGYPRTPEGFFHALTRGQYDKINPTDIFHEPLKFVTQLGMLFNGLADAFSWVYMFIALLPLLFLFRMQKREKAWIITVASIYPFLGILLTIFLDPTPERQTADLVKVFYTASHAVVAIMIGYGLALTAAYMATHYDKFRRWGLIGGSIAVALALFSVVDVTGLQYFGLLGWPAGTGVGDIPHWIAQSFAPDQYGLPVFGVLILAGITVVFLASVLLYRTRAPLLITLLLFLLMPICSGFSHWFHSEQRNHWFGYWFGHDMFTPPYVDATGKLTYDPKGREAAAKGPKGAMVYPEMARDAVLFGGTDPGRFCPTYMIFCESFIPHKDQPEQDQNFDRRDVYIITQNALADNTYLDYIRAQFFRSAQQDPPFFQNFLATALPKIFKGPVRALGFLDNIFEGLGARIEWRRRTESSLFKPDDFIDLKGFTAKLRKGAQTNELSKYIYSKLSPETQKLVDSGGDDSALRRGLARDLNVVLAGGSIYDAERFKGITLPKLVDEAVHQNQLDATKLRLNRVMLEDAYPGMLATSVGGVYPDTEIYTPSPVDSQECFNVYLNDAQRRYEHDSRFPNEPRQMKPGEDVRPAPNGAGVQVAGQVAVMSINGLLTKVIFDHNPDHEFYVEESFPLDWMYPYLTPFGVIMKINREPLPEMPQAVMDKDHAFWSEYSTRTIGNWITYDTTISNICAFCEKTYLRHDYSGFNGDRRFIRDDDGQKAFSKLRSSIGSSIYWWRATHPANQAEAERTFKEAEFALKQAFAYCPYSPEAVFHLMQLLLARNRIEEAIMVLKTCHKLDPYNGQITDWITNLEQARQKGGNSNTSGNVTIQQFLDQVQQQIAARNTNVADHMLQQILDLPQADAATLIHVADLYLRLGDMGKSEQAVTKLTQVAPDSYEAWYNLGIIQSARGKTADAVHDLQKAVALNDGERAKNASLPNLREHLMTDASLGALKQSAEFRAAFATNH
jgi:tetratricopeptide (TPR) repeat protein